MDTWDIPSLHIEPRHPKVLRSDDETRLITLVLPAGEELKEHQVHERSYVIVLSGEINAIHGGETVTGGPGFLAHFQPNERRTIRAVSDAQFLIVLAPWPGVGHPSRLARGGAIDRARRLTIYRRDLPREGQDFGFRAAHRESARWPSSGGFRRAAGVIREARYDLPVVRKPGLRGEQARARDLAERIARIGFSTRHCALRNSGERPAHECDLPAVRGERGDLGDGRTLHGVSLLSLDKRFCVLVTMARR
jgi:quercetin dioxygenase-like cupin family protein